VATTAFPHRKRVVLLGATGSIGENTLRVIAAHDTATPLFLNYAPHLVHAPMQAPASYLAKFSFIRDKTRATYAAMVSMLDDVVGDVADALKARGMWENTLFVVWSDNGGPIYINGSSGANNFPLRGGKVSNWEGGVRTNAFLSGGLVPQAKRGTVHDDLIACWDWYSSFCELAGVAPADAAAAAAGLPPIDSVSQLPYIFGLNTTPPRTVVELGVPITPGVSWGDFKYNLDNGRVFVGGVVTKRWKLLLRRSWQQ
jgi:arylsulfatase I/J